MLLTLATALAACETSPIDPEAEVHVRGQVTAPDGGPLGNRPVRLGTGVGFGDGAVGVITLGLSCTDGSCSGNVFDATTDSNGSFDITMKGRDTQSSFGEPLSVLVGSSAAPGAGQVSGPTVAARFRVMTEDVRLPVLSLVDPGLVLKTSVPIEATWSTPRPGPYELTFEGRSTLPVWKLVTTGSPATVDPRLLEDTVGRALLSATATDAIEGSDVTIRWRSPGVPYVAGAGAPPSRGRPCHYVDAAGNRDDTGPECRLTDGDLARGDTTSPVCRPGPTPDEPVCAAAVAAEVDLARPVPAELIAVRGCTGGCPVEVSDDGSSFRAVGSVSDDFGLVGLDGRPVRAVRVGLGPNGTEAELREISVWGPIPAAPPLGVVDAGRTDDLREALGVDGGDNSGPPPWLLVLAGVAILGIVAGVAYRAGRRRPDATQG